MSQLNLKGKKKSDLALIAQMAGLLTTTQTRKMTKQELLDFLISEQDKIATDRLEDKAEVKKESGSKPRADKKSKKPEEEKEQRGADDKAGQKDEAKKILAKSPPSLQKQAEKETAPAAADELAVADEPAAVDEPAVIKGQADSTEKRAGGRKSSPKSLTDKGKTVKRGRTVQIKSKKEAPAKDLKAVAEDFDPKEQKEIEEREESGKNLPAVEVSPPELYGGVLEIMQDNYGFLRRDNYLQSSNDIYVPPQYIRRFNLRTGDYVIGPCRQQRENDRYQALSYVKEVNGLPPDQIIKRPHFDRLTPIYPNERFALETTRQELSTRIIDLVAPIGKGQRGMIVSPPKAGKTILLQKIAKAISVNNPDAKLIVLLIDERPEEVTDMQRSIDGEVVYSTFDKTPENHVRITELVLERAMRLVELNQDVVILLDSITRMGRAYNLTITPTGRTLSGGLDPGALYGPKRFFGAARNIENGGSLTIIATALIETGSRMDEVIFEEFKGTGNMEVLLDRKLSEKRIFPAIDITRSSTRREELLLSAKELDAVWGIRKAFGSLDTAAVTETIISLLMKTRNNEQFVSSINISFNDKSLFDAMRGNIKNNSGNGK